MLARDRRKALLKQQLNENTFDQLMKAHNPEQKRQKREEQALLRARERLTLKTRKASQWASDMFINRHSKDPRSRQEILEQVRAKDILRREILGKNEESDDSDSDSDADDSSDGDKEALNQDDLRDITGDVSENEEQVVGRRSFKPKNDKVANAENRSKDFVNEDLDSDVQEDMEEEEEKEKEKEKERLSSKKQSMLTNFNKKIEKQAASRTLFQQHIQHELQVSDEFKRAKEAETTEDAPRQEDLTLAGWGSWTGPNYKNLPNKPPKVTKSIPGVAPAKRKDAKLKHVIITEKRMNVSGLEAPAVPFPFTSREQYERSLNMGGLGPEWNTQKSFLAKTAKRVKIQAGAVIEPARIKSTTSNI